MSFCSVITASAALLLSDVTPVSTLAYDSLQEQRYEQQISTGLVTCLVERVLIVISVHGLVLILPVRVGGGYPHLNILLVSRAADSVISHQSLAADAPRVWLSRPRL